MDDDAILALGYTAPSITTTDQLEEARERYADDPSVQWYIARRAKAIAASAAVEQTGAMMDDVVTAAGQMLTDYPSMIKPVRSREDLPAAIRAAAEDPGMRWYVEKRLRALHAEDEFTLPWRKT